MRKKASYKKLWWIETTWNVAWSTITKILASIALITTLTLLPTHIDKKQQKEWLEPKDIPETIDKEKIKEKADSIQNIALNFYNEGAYNVALPEYLNALWIYKSLEDHKNAYYCNIDIGKIHFFGKDFDKALEYFQQALNEVKQTEYNRWYFITITFLIRAYWQKKDTTNIEKYYEEWIQTYEKINQKENIEKNDPNTHKYYIKFLVYTAGEFYNNNQLNKFITVMETLKNIKTDELDEETKIFLYTYKWHLALIKKQYKKALKYYNSQKKEQEWWSYYISIIRKWNLYQIYKELWRQEEKSWRSEEALIYYKKAIKYYEEYKDETDSITYEKNQKEYAKQEVKYRTKEKETEIETQKLTIENQKKKTKNLIYWLFTALGVAWWLWIMYDKMRKARKTAKQEKLNAEQEREIAEAAKEIAEIANRKLEEAKNELETKNYELKKAEQQSVQSINYANTIQSTMLPKDKEMKELFDKFFVLFKPRDGVSGDFYRTKNIDGKSLFAQIDYEWHGVPGALLSAIWYNIFEDAVNRENNTPASILNYLDRKIKEIFKDENGKSIATIMLISYDKKTGQLTYAWSKSEMIYIPNQEDNDTIGKNIEEIHNRFGKAYLIKWTPNRLGQDLHGEEKNKKEKFTNKTLDINNGGVFYMFSDGYKDQFGSTQFDSAQKRKDKKFMKANLIELLMAIKDKDMKKQKELLEITLKKFMGNYEQTDDISVFGFKFDKIDVKKWDSELELDL